MDDNFELPKKKDEKENSSLEEEKALLAEVVKEVNLQEQERKEKERLAKLKEEKAKEEKVNNEEVKKIESTNTLKEKRNLYKLIIIIIIFVIALIGYRIYLNKLNEPETVKTIEEQIIDTLNNRYGKQFTKVNDTTYLTSDNVKVTIETNANSSSKLIIFDDYLKTVQIDKITNKINSILQNNNIKGATIELEPEADCRFIGSCVNTYYFKSYKDNTDDSLLSERSSEIVLKDYVQMDNVEFFNNVGFMLYIKVNGDYSSYDKESLKEGFKNLFKELNSLGYKNKLGYDIVVKTKDGIEDVLVLKADKDPAGTFDIYTAKES